MAKAKKAPPQEKKEVVKEQDTPVIIVQKNGFHVSTKHIIIVSASVIMLLVGVSSVYFYTQYQHAQQLLSNAQGVNPQNEIKKITDKIGNVIQLPTETPTLATVSDVTKLKDQSFFAHAQNGDKVLIYKNSKKALLYRPSTEKVIEIAPINLNTSSTTPPAEVAGAATEAESSRVAIYNGTTRVGLTKIAETKLKDAIEGIDVVVKENAARSDYKGTVVVDLKGKSKKAADQLAKTVNGTVATLPEGEDAPAEADILVILGSDYSQN